MKAFSLVNPPEFTLRPGWKDRYETKVSQWLQPWQEGDMPDIGFIGVPLSKTSISVSAASMTPNALRELFGKVTTYQVDEDVDISSLSGCDLGDIRMHPTDLLGCHANIEQGLAEVFAQLPTMLPIIAGGDHSITCPSVKAFAKQYAGRVGIIQFDAHMDVRNLTDGGPTNGTPIRGLLESGTVEGRHIVQLGIHNFANAKPYRDYAREQGITQFTARQVYKESIESLVEQAIAIAGNGTDAIYVTVDMDVLDQAYAPGVPAMVPGGMSSWQLLEALLLLGRHSKVKALDVVCVDPLQDPRRATVRTALHGILNFVTGYCQRTVR